MNTTEIKDSVVKILAEVSRNDEKEIRTLSLAEAEIDSLTLTEAVFHIEEQFDIGIEDEELAAIQSLDDIVALISNKAGL